MKQAMKLIEEDTGKEYALDPSEKEVALALDNNNVTVQEKATRRSLVSLRFSGGKVFLSDLGSDEGTYYRHAGEKEWCKIGEEGSELLDDDGKRREMNKGTAVFDMNKTFEFMIGHWEVLKFSPKH